MLQIESYRIDKKTKNLIVVFTRGEDLAFTIEFYKDYSGFKFGFGMSLLNDLLETFHLLLKISYEIYNETDFNLESIMDFPYDPKETKLNK